LGLPDHGDRNLKIWRHKEYINLYNANFDSQSPVNASTLVQKLATIEQSYLNDKNNQSKRKTPDSTVHLQRYKSEFQILIEDAKKRSKKSGKY
jgi:E3 ubiquitin-protein ligase RAD18